MLDVRQIDVCKLTGVKRQNLDIEQLIEAANLDNFIIDTVFVQKNTLFSMSTY